MGNHIKLNKGDIYPAPVIPLAFPPTISTLSALIEQEGPGVQLLFALGNVLLREERLKEAEARFKEALAMESPKAEIFTNLGVTYLLQDKPEEALSNFRQAILLDSNQLLPHLHSAKAQLRLKNFSAAKISFEKVLKLDLSNPEALRGMAQLSLREGQIEQTLEYYGKLFELDPNCSEAKTFLAREEFKRVRALFEAGNSELAFATWSRSSNRYYPIFQTDQILLSGMGEIAKQYATSGELRQKEQELGANWLDLPLRAKNIHQYVSGYLLGLGLVPEFYEPIDTLKEEKLRWQSSLAKLGEHPYAHFRIAIIELFQGNVDAAEAKLRHCQDKFPGKKQGALRLSRVLELAMELKSIERSAIDGFISPNNDQEWLSAGFSNIFESNPWKLANFQPWTAKEWKDYSFTATKANLWLAEEFSPAEAQYWLHAGLSDPKRARRWSKANVPPDQAAAWELYFPDKPELAIQCKNVGFEDPQLASAWLKLVMFPWDAIRWHELGYTPDQAREYIENGISDPNRAKEEELINPLSKLS